MNWTPFNFAIALIVIVAISAVVTKCERDYLLAPVKKEIEELKQKVNK